MSKYIIELDDDIKYLIINGRADNRCYTLVRPVAELEILNSDYINENFVGLQDDAYNRGYEDGAKSVENWNNEEKKLRLDEAFDRGLTVAWEAARKIVTWPDRSLINSDTFDLDHGENIFVKYSASEAIAKLKAYEDKQKDRIEVGDEVIWNTDDITLIVTSAYESGSNWCGGISQDGRVFRVLAENVRKTGKHYDIQSILEAMRE